MRSTIPSLAKISKIPNQAKAPIFSWEMIVDVNGTVSKPNTNDRIEAWNTTPAAPILSAGIVILLFKNQIPTVSEAMTMTKANAICISNDVPNTVFSLSLLPVPSSNVRNRLTDDVSAEEISENIDTNPPTAPYIP